MFYINQKLLEGYAFPVYTTESCPKNKTEWTDRSSLLNCTNTNGYTCITNENFTELLQFCYTDPRIRIQKGKNSRWTIENISNIYLTFCILNCLRRNLIMFHWSMMRFFFKYRMTLKKDHTCLWTGPGTTTSLPFLWFFFIYLHMFCSILFSNLLLLITPHISLKSTKKNPEK